MTRTAARVEISHLEITSSSSHSDFETSGITLRALRHIAKFISKLLVSYETNYIYKASNGPGRLSAENRRFILISQTATLRQAALIRGKDTIPFRIHFMINGLKFRMGLK